MYGEITLHTGRARRNMRKEPWIGSTRLNRSRIVNIRQRTEAIFALSTDKAQIPEAVDSRVIISHPSGSQCEFSSSDHVGCLELS